MAQRVVPLTVVVPTGTTAAAPAYFSLKFAPSEVERIDVRVPPGPSGLVGFAIQNGGGNYIPEGSGTYIIADDQYMQWPLSDAPDNGNWTVAAYNTDVVTHTLYFFFLISSPTVASVPASSGLVGL